MDPLILLEAAAKAHVKMKVKLSCAEFCKSFDRFNAYDGGHFFHKQRKAYR
jgi:hypothetical protein